MLVWILLIVVAAILLFWLWKSGAVGTPVRHQCSTCPNKKIVGVE